MTPSEILASVKRDIIPYLVSSYIDNFIAEGDFTLSGAEESMLNSSIKTFASEGNPNRVVSKIVAHSDEESTVELDFPEEFAAVIQIRDSGLQNVPYQIDTDNSKIIVATGPQYYGPYDIRYRYKLEDYFGYDVDADGIVTVNADKDLSDISMESLIKDLLKAKLEEYNNTIIKMGNSLQMELPAPESQGEETFAKENIRSQVVIQPSLFN